MNALFGLSLFPYLAFLWYAQRSGRFPKLALWGFYFTLVFVALTIPTGLYCLLVLKTTLSNVDWLHGPAESLLTISNILVVIGFKQAIDRTNKQPKT